MTEAAAAALWERWIRDRDGAAFRALVVPELPRAVAVARGTGCDASRAEDAVQDALIALARERTSAPLDVGLRVWFFRAVRDRARSALRSEKRRRGREAVAARPESVAGDVSRNEGAELVERALAQLEPGDREAVRLRFALDLDYAEVSRVIGTSEGAARVRVHRALEKLRKLLGGDAATRLAALPLPVVLRAETLVGSAIAKSAVAGAAGIGAGALAGTGGMVMATSKATVAVTAVVALVMGAAITAAVGVGGGGWGAGTARDGSVPHEPKVAAEGPQESRPRARAGREQPSATVESSAAAAEAALIDVGAADLAPTDEERTWLRQALIAERQRRVQAAIRYEDTGVDILRRYLEHKADVEPVLASFESAQAHVRTPAEATVRFDAPETFKKEGLLPADATVYEFGPGRFDLRGASRKFFDRREKFEAFEIRGAGKDATTLVVGRSEEFFLGGEGRNIAFRDVTIENPGSDSTFFDVRGRASIAFERVRFAGWLTTAGHSSVLGISGQAFLACRECEFAGNGGGLVLSLRGPGLAVFERCTFTDVYSAIIGGGAGSAGRPSVVRMIDCTFENARLADSRIMRNGMPQGGGGQAGAGEPRRAGLSDTAEVDLRVRGGTANVLGPKATEEERRKRWGAEYAASVEGVTFGPTTAWFSFADALRAAEVAASSGMKDIVGMDVQSGRRGAPAELDFYVLDRERGSVVRRTRRFTGGTLTEVAETRRGMRGFAGIDAAAVDSTLPFATVLARSGVDPAESFDHAVLMDGGVRGSGRLWTVGVFGEGQLAIMDAATGEKLR